MPRTLIPEDLFINNNTADYLSCRRIEVRNLVLGICKPLSLA